jgi:hypothetical protein
MLCRVITSEVPHPAGAIRATYLPLTMQIRNVALAMQSIAREDWIWTG